MESAPTGMYKATFLNECLCNKYGKIWNKLLIKSHGFENIHHTCFHFFVFRNFFFLIEIRFSLININFFRFCIWNSKIFIWLIHRNVKCFPSSLITNDKKYGEIFSPAEIRTLILYAPYGFQRTIQRVYDNRMLWLYACCLLASSK